MKKPILVATLLAALVVQGVHAAPAPIDFIVLLDTSESMLPYWDETTNYLIKDIIANQLHKGDTFHLISFSSRPEVEIARQIETRQDIQAILARLLLLQPLGRYTDLVAAVKYLYQYTIDLPLSTQKEILILTDGIDDPPPDSPFPIKYGPNGQDMSGNRQQIIDTAESMRRHGWDVHIIQYPLQGTPAPGAAAQQGTQLLSGGPSPTAAGQGGAVAGSAVAGTSAGRGAGGSSSTVTAGAAAGGASSTPGAGGVALGSGGGAGGSSSAAAAGGTAGRATAGGAGAAQAPGAQAPLLNQLSQTLGVPIQQFEGASKQEISHVATGAPSLTFPGNLGKVGYDLTVPFRITNYQDQPILVQLSGVTYEGANILRRAVTQPLPPHGSVTLKAPLHLPSSLAPGPHTLPIGLQFADSLRVSPYQGNLSFTLTRGLITAQDASAVILPVALGILVVVVIVLVVFFVRRIVAGMGAAPSVSIAPQVRYDVTRSSIRPIELRVIGQNPNIGGRNIHPIGSGARRSIGGGNSSFLIYLHAVPPHIAEVTHDGDGYVLTPLRPEFFPTLSGPLRNCLGRDIHVRTGDNRTLTMTLREYVSPLDEVNRIMHLVDKAGIPSTRG